MRLVDREQRQPRAIEQFQETRCDQPLRRDVKQV
jgi:hypothetical protein